MENMTEIVAEEIKTSDLTSFLGKNLEKYSKCLTELSKADLQGRYKKAFDKLKKQICVQEKELFMRYVTDPFVFFRELTEEECAEEISFVEGLWAQYKEETKKNDLEGLLHFLKNAQESSLHWFLTHGAGIKPGRLDGGDYDFLEEGGESDE